MPICVQVDKTVVNTGFLNGGTAAVSENVRHGADVKTIGQNWLELSKTRHNADSQMPGRVHALV